MNIAQHAPSFETIPDSVEHALMQLKLGNPYTLVSLNNPVVGEIKQEVEALRGGIGRALFRPHGRNDVNPWQGVTRATFLNEASHDGWKMRALARTVLKAESRVPALHEFGDEVSAAMKKSASNIPTLAGWYPNRLGINAMKGSVKRPASIGTHTDVPTEHGVVVTMLISPMTGASPGRYPVVNNLAFIFGADTCDYFDLDQNPHDETAHEKRLSITLADLRPQQSQL